MLAPDARVRPCAQRSLRSRLALGYAAIALLTAVVLGLILVVALPPFFGQVERDNAASIASDVITTLKESGGVGPDKSGAVDQVVSEVARAEECRVRILDSRGEVMADSGEPANAFSASKVVVAEPFENRDGKVVATVEVSAVTKGGAGVTRSIVLAWAIASALAVALGAGVGYYLSGRVSHPITELTDASGRMAAGDLGVRAEVEGDDEIAVLASAFNEMAEGIEDTFWSLKRFVGDAAHEIGTPLTALQTDLELARERPDDAAVPELLDRALGHSERIRKLTRDLLVLSRLESVGAVEEPVPVDLHELAVSAADGMASRAEQAEVELELRVVDAPVVMGDSSALGRALDNVLDNALKFTPAGGVVRLSVAAEGEWALVRVADTGTGVSAEDVPHVFERFHRSRTAASVPGSGLGLAIVKAIVDAHGGTVVLESSPGSGTVVTMRFRRVG